MIYYFLLIIIIIINLSYMDMLFLREIIIIITAANCHLNYFFFGCRWLSFCLLFRRCFLNVNSAFLLHFVWRIYLFFDVDSCGENLCLIIIMFICYYYLFLLK